MTPARLINPTVGLSPTMPQVLEGQTIDPSVSVPMETAHRFAEVADPDPKLSRRDSGPERTDFDTGRRGRSTHWTIYWTGYWPIR